MVEGGEKIKFKKWEEENGKRNDGEMIVLCNTYHRRQNVLAL